jgi:uncharacterized membrane protein YcaP (DUF421 family)
MDAYDYVSKLLGLDLEPQNLDFLQVSLRAIVVFIAALVMVRTGAKRFLGRKAAFDIILAFILGSMLSRAISGSAPFFPTLLGGFVLVWFHRLIAALSFRFHKLGTLVKGTDDIIIENGKVNTEAMRKNFLSERDLLEDLRLKSHESPAEIKTARIERSGDLSVIAMKR